MFISLPEFHMQVPVPLALPGAFYARAMTLSTNAAWFILTIRCIEPDPICETFLVAWDTDVIELLKTTRGEFESLLFVAPKRVGKRICWQGRQIVELWDATDPRDGSACSLMVADDGQGHSGYFMESRDDLVRRQLIARTAEPVTTSRE